MESSVFEDAWEDQGQLKTCCSVLRDGCKTRDRRNFPSDFGEVGATRELHFLAEELRHVAELAVAGIEQLSQRHTLNFRQILLQSSI